MLLRKEVDVAQRKTSSKSLLPVILGALFGMAIKKKGYISVAILAFIAGFMSHDYFLNELLPKWKSLETAKFSNRNHRELGEPGEADQVLDRLGYSLGYNYKTKSALWVSYILSADSASVDVGRSGNFYADKDIPEEYRVKPTDLTNSGYDKGHLAPSGSIDFSVEANKQTFAMSNVVPQDPKMNREGWSAVEELERKWAGSKGKLYIITGPIYAKRPKEVNGVPVPSKLYKVIYAYDAEKAIGFLMPNTPVTEKDIWEYAMPLKSVEEETGLDFFDKLPANTQQRAKSKLDKAWWQAE